MSVKGACTVSDRPRHGGAWSRHGSLVSAVRPMPGLKRRLRDECKDLFLKKLSCFSWQSFIGFALGTYTA
jgi:hypothetical protein